MFRDLCQYIPISISASSSQIEYESTDNVFKHYTLHPLNNDSSNFHIRGECVDGWGVVGCRGELLLWSLANGENALCGDEWIPGVLVELAGL